MGNRCVVKNKCFIDEFDLPLYEDSTDDYYTVEEIKQEVGKRIMKLASLGGNCTISVDSIIKYEIINKSKNIAEVEPVDTHKYIFRITQQVARKRNERYLDTIIYHELCHILQVEFLLNANILYFENNELSYDSVQKDLAEFLYDTDGGHTKLWYHFTKIINAAFVINPPIDRFLTDKDASDPFLENTFKRDSVRVKNTKIIDDFSYLFKDEKLED